MYLAIVFIGGGSSWVEDKDKDTAERKVRKLAASDWGSLFNIDPKKLRVNILDATNVSGWYATYEGVFNRKNDQRLKLIEVR